MTATHCTANTYGLQPAERQKAGKDGTWSGFG